MILKWDGINRSNFSILMLSIFSYVLLAKSPSALNIRMTTMMMTTMIMFTFSTDECSHEYS